MQHFDTIGGWAHITHSRYTISKTAAPGQPAPDFNGAINVVKERVNGVDIVVPAFRFSETLCTDVDVDPAHKIALASLCGKVNDAPFRGFSAGEVLFCGASSSRTGHGAWEITYHFAGNANSLIRSPDRFGDFTLLGL